MKHRERVALLASAKVEALERELNYAKPRSGEGSRKRVAEIESQLEKARDAAKDADAARGPVETATVEPDEERAEDAAEDEGGDADE